jgi:plastocyanin
MRLDARTILPWRSLFFGMVFLGMVFGCTKPELDQVRVTPKESTLRVGETATFKAVAVSASGKLISGKGFRWSVDGDAGTVDDSGRFTAQKPGEVTVVATVSGRSGRAMVTVEPRPVTGLTLTVEAARALAGSTLSVEIKGFSADEKPAGYNEVSLSSPAEGVSFSPENVLLDETGGGETSVTIAGEPGENTIVARSGEITEMVSVEGTRITSLQITPPENVFETGQRVDFKALGVDPYGNTLPVEPTWSLTDGHAELDADGSVLMKEPGEAILLARYGEIKQGFTFTVVPGSLSSIAIEPSDVHAKAGDRVTFTTKCVNAFGAPLPCALRWQVAGDIGSITLEGSFFAKRAGKGSVKAEAGDVSSETAVEVEHGPLAGIAILLDQPRVVAGTTVALSAEGVDAFGNRFPVTPQWFLSKSVGVINQQDSTFTALYPGSGEIRAKIDKIVGGRAIEVAPAELSRLQFVPQGIDIIAGETVQFAVKGLDRFGNEVDVTPEFSVRDDLGQLSPDGTFAAKKVGSTVVEARYGEIKAESALAVTAGDIKTVLVDPSGPMILTAGQVQEFQAFGVDEFGNTVESTLLWSVTPELGVMDEKTGSFRPERAGKGQILTLVTQSRTDMTVEARVGITVIPAETATIEIFPREITTRAGGEATRFTATAYDRFGNETGATVGWSLSEATLGRITPEGVFSAVRAGGGDVLARYEEVVGKASVEVFPGRLAFLKIVPESLALKAGEGVRLQAVGEDAFGNVVKTKVIWTLSDPAIAVIDAEGLLSAGKEGKGYLLAAADDIVDAVPVEVRKGDLTVIDIQPGEAEVTAGATVSFSATGSDAGGNQIMIEPVWSADEAIGTVDSAGMFSAKIPGEGFVTAGSGDIRGTARVKVVLGAPATVHVEPESIEARSGEMVPMTFQVFDAAGNLISNPDFSWEVDNGLGVVRHGNEFTARKAGSGAIRLIAGAASTEIPVTVLPGPVHLIEIVPHGIETTAGEELSFTAAAYDRDGNAVECTPAWTVEGGIGTVGEDGVFRALTAGSGLVAAQAEGITGVARVSVKTGPLERIAVTPEETKLTAGSTVDFVAVAFDAQENVVPAEFAWTLQADPPIGDIGPTGQFRAVRAGMGKVLAAADGAEGVSLVTVIPADLRRIGISPEQIDLTAGDRATISFGGEDEFGNPVAISPEFRVVPETLGTIDPDGSFAAKKIGSGLVTVTADGVETSVPVLVKAGELKRLVIELPGAALVAGDTYTFHATGYDAGDNEISVAPSWAVTKNLGKIDQATGVFYANKTGTGMVVAYSDGVIAEATLAVQPGSLQSLFIEPDALSLKSGDLQEFGAKGLDAEGNEIRLSASALEWAVVGGIGAFETPGLFRGTVMGKGKVTAAIAGLGAETNVTVLPGKADPDSSRIRVTYPILPADGSAFSDVIVEVRDACHNPVPGALVTLVSNRREDSIVQPEATDASGLSRGRISSELAGDATVSGVVEGRTLPDTAEILFE